MLAAPAIRNQAPASGLRPLDPRRDGQQVFRLLDICFGPLLDLRGRHYDFSQSGHFPSVPYLAGIGRRESGLVPGFVWEERGRIVGNVSIVRSSIRDRYLIANVAVHPEYRRQGIARSLMAEVVRYLQNVGAREVLLQVKKDNEAATRLYRDLGFSIQGARTQWETSTERLRPPLSTEDKDWAVTRLPRRLWREAYRLDVAAVPPPLNWPAPPKRTKYKRNLWDAFVDLLNGRKVKTWMLYHVQEDTPRDLFGLVNLCSEWARPHTIELRISPDADSVLSRHLLGVAFREVKRSRRGTVRLDHLAEDENVNDLLAVANFRIRRTLSVMRLDLRGVQR